jgi:heme A synthase
MRPQPEGRRLAFLARAGFGLVLLVVLISVAIRLGQTATPPLGAGMMLALRSVHRSAASLEVLVVLWLAWLAWRGRSARPAFARGTALALAITVFLSVLGIAAGQSPPPLAALGNLLGGLALAVNFAWLAGSLRGNVHAAPACAIALGAALLALQCVLGARLSVLEGAAGSPALPAHGMLGLLLAAGLFWLAAPRGGRAGWRSAAMTLAAFVLLTGFTALQFDFSRTAAFAHAAAAALLVAAVAYVHGRLA